ncbi:MAG TPA: M2 family metallopeptidase [Allosphingosinicella sp.]|nr:M2 family metallopeptidase [Allosphingosinicella sp.]
MQAKVSLLALAALLAGCATASTVPDQSAATAADVDAFLARAEKELGDYSVIHNRAQWVNETYITDDTDAVAAYFGTIGTEMDVRYAGEAARYQKLPGLSADAARKLDILRNRIVMPAPATAGAAAELNAITVRLNSAYGKGRGTMGGKVMTGNDLEEKMGTVRDPALLKEMWSSWHDNVGGPMRGDYRRMVEIGNQGAKQLGYADVGAMWRSGYDMPPDDFARLVDRLWEQVKPLYDQLHCYTRARLNQKYGDGVQPATGPIRADLLGNMWAQQWGNIYDIVAPKGAGDIGYDLTDLLVKKKYDPIRMMKTGEGFYTSLGFPALPDSFWTRSMIVAPRDRDVICHASAWDVDNQDDLRVKMCTKVDADDFVTIHHELGHNFYQRAYNKQTFLYQDSANDGFHEAVGDFVALSVTPDYLVRLGLLDSAKVPPEDKDIGLLLRQAMDKVAFLPFGLLVDKWRWGVFDGSIAPDRYNQAWTDLRRRYQGIVPPVTRTEANFDPGAKYHIPGNTPYARYFLARILQFQFYQAACDQAGWKGPLHRCSFYGDKQVGARFNAMLAMGRSKPWPDALEAFTGSREISGDAMIAYFRPLLVWLQAQNKGRQCGW